MPLDTVRVFLIAKLSWIRAQRRKLQAQERETPREFLNKESHYLWGKRYLLEVSTVDAAPRVDRSPRKLHLWVRPGTEQSRYEEVLDACMRTAIPS